jgi:hypothetical protein
MPSRLLIAPPAVSHIVPDPRAFDKAAECSTILAITAFKSKTDMAEETSRQQRFWIAVVAIVILLVFLYFYRPFEVFLTARIPNIHFSNTVFWFASLVGIFVYLVAHWQSFRAEIFRPVTELNVETLVFDTLQAAILAVVIFCAGATLQAIEMLGEYFINRGPIFEAAFGEKLLAIFLLVIFAVLFYLLHYAIRAIRTGWLPRRAPPRIR